MDNQDGQEKEAQKSALEKLNDARKKNKRRYRVQQAIKAVIAFLAAFGKYILIGVLVVTVFAGINKLLNGGNGNTAYASGSFVDVSSLSGNNIQEKIWFAIRNSGYSAEATAGIMGNIDWESGGFDSTRVEDGSGEGIGLCQWSFSRKASLESFANSKGKEITDENLQIEFLLGELGLSGYAEGFATDQFMKVTKDGVTYTKTTWENAKTPEEAAKAFCIAWERPADGKEHFDEREKAARKYYDMYKDKNFTAGTGSSGGTADFVPDDTAAKDWINGTFTINGKTFYVYNQNMDSSYESSIGLENWAERCNRAASVCITSGYVANSKEDALALMQKIDNQTVCPPDEGWFNSYGLKLNRTVYDNTKEYDYRNDLRTALNSGKEVLIYVRGEDNQKSTNGGTGVSGITGIGKSGANWTNRFHWLAILGYRNENGKEEIFIANSTTAPSGWYGIDEFLVNNGKEVANLYTVGK